MAEEEKPEGRGRGQRVTKEANQAQDAWEADVMAAIAELQDAVFGTPEPA